MPIIKGQYYPEMRDEFGSVIKPYDTKVHLETSADVVLYDGGESGLSATTAQGAIDELEEEIGDNSATIGQLVSDVQSNTTAIEDLALALAGGKDLKNWKDVQTIVRMGVADKMFKVGDQFVSSYDTGQVVWDVIGINHDIPTDKRYKNSLTLQAHDRIMNCQFDAPEAFYYAETELAVGTHIFTLNAVQYTFTTTQAIPQGGQAYISSWQTAGFVPTKITTYAVDRTTAIETGLDVTSTTGTDTLTPINNYARCRYGSNNYAESAIKQFLNSDVASFVWTPKTNFDRPPSGAPFTGGGFLKLLDQELVAVLGAVDKQVAKNTVTDGGGQDLFSDKVFLLSRVEVFGGGEGVVTGENAYAWYSALAGSSTSGDLAGRIKYLTGSARNWWLRSPHVGQSHSPRIVGTTGNVHLDYAHNSSVGLAPACCIV